MKDIRIGLIGAGFMGKAHATAFKNVPLVFGNEPGRPVLEVIADVVSVIGLVPQESFRSLLGEIDQLLVAFAVGRLSRREVERDGPSFGISETVNFTGEPAPRAAKSSLMSPPFPPAAETWARTVVLSML